MAPTLIFLRRLFTILKHSFSYPQGDLLWYDLLLAGMAVFGLDLFPARHDHADDVCVHVHIHIDAYFDVHIHIDHVFDPVPDHLSSPRPKYSVERST